MTHEVPRLHAVILAGGSGTRFWPLSRELSPKQTLSIFGGISLITRAVRRIMAYCPAGTVHVVTGERLFDELRNHLSAQEELTGLGIDYLVEPAARNTAPAIALAAAVLLGKDPDAIMIVLPSDHLLEDGPAWEATVGCAAKMASAGHIVTIGLQPTRPETGYGYIKAGDVLLECDGAACHAVEMFAEKPDAETARRFVEDGSYLWNAGMVVARADVVLAELRAAGVAARTPESTPGARIADEVERLAAMPAGKWASDEARERYAALPAVPFDKAVLEVSGKVAVVPTRLDWSDVGSLLAIEKLAEPDERGNVCVGRTVDVDSRDSIVYSADRLVATLGLDDIMVVDTPDATLVAAKERAQDVRLIVDALKASGADEVVSSRESLRPWGRWELLMKGGGFQIKEIDVLPGKRLSLQSHEHRAEHWIVVSGSAVVTRGDDSISVKTGESVFIPQHALHRLANESQEVLRVIEVAVGDYLGEDDIVRYDDDFGR